MTELIKRKIYLNVCYEEKEQAKQLGAKFDWNEKLWYIYEDNENIDSLCSQFEKYNEIKELQGENRDFGGNLLLIDLTPSSTWYENVRSKITRHDWQRIRRHVYDRVNYCCEICGIYCKHKRLYDEDLYEKNNYHKNICKNGDVEYTIIKDNGCTIQWTESVDCELKLEDEELRWNTIALEAHERWSYDLQTQTQRLERLIALCHRCHTSTHMGLAGIRHLSDLAKNHIKRVNGWSEEQYNNLKSDKRTDEIKPKITNVDITFLRSFIFNDSH